MPDRSDLEICLVFAVTSSGLWNQKKLYLVKKKTHMQLKPSYDWGSLAQSTANNMSEEEVAASCHCIVTYEVNNSSNKNLSFIIKPQLKGRD